MIQLSDSCDLINSLCTNDLVNCQSTISMLSTTVCVVASDGLCYAENAIVANPLLVCVPSSCPKGHPFGHLWSYNINKCKVISIHCGLLKFTDNNMI